MRRRGTSAEERTLHVHRIDIVPVLLLHAFEVVERDEVRRRRVVHEDVQSAEPFDRLIDHRTHLVVLRDVGLHEERRTAGLLDQPHSLARVILRAGVIDDDVGAAAREIERGGPSDAHRRARHDRGLAIDVHDASDRSLLLMRRYCQQSHRGARCRSAAASP